MATTINETNIYDRGMLIVLNETGYSGYKKLSKEEIQEAGLPEEIVRGVHNLFEKSYKEKLDNITLFDNKTRAYVKDRSVPFHKIKSVYFLGYDRIDMIEQYIEERKIQREELVNELVEDYDNAVQSFAKKYPKYYRKAMDKYPTKDKFKRKFSFDYSFIQIAAPSKNSKLTPEQYRRAKEQFTQTIEAVKKDVVNTIYTDLLELTGRLKRQSKDGKMSQRTFNSLNEYFAKIEEVYSEFVDRKDMTEAINKVKQSVLGKSADMLRDNDGQRNKFHKAIAALTKEIKALPDVELKRAIDF